MEKELKDASFLVFVNKSDKADSKKDLDYYIDAFKIREMQIQIK